MGAGAGVGAGAAAGGTIVPPLRTGTHIGGGVSPKANTVPPFTLEDESMTPGSAATAADAALAVADPRQRVLRRRNAASMEGHNIPGYGWRQLRAPTNAMGLKNKSRNTQVLGSTMSTGLNVTNKATVVGLVNPRDVSDYDTWVPDLIMRTFVVEDIVKELERSGAGRDALEASIAEDAGGAAFLAEEERKRIEAEQKANRKADMVTSAFRLVKSNKFGELEDLLLEGEVDVNMDRDEQGNTLLLAAAQNGLKRIAKLLLRKGADINAVNLNGNGVLHYCFAYKFKELAEYFKSKGADDTLLNVAGLTCYEADVTGGVSMDGVEAI